MWILPCCTISFHYFQSKMLFLWIGSYSSQHRINTCHNSCCETSINCQAMEEGKKRKKEAGFNWEWKKLAQTNRCNKYVICLGRFGELPWSGLQLYSTCHHRQIDKQPSFNLYWISHRHWLECFITVIAYLILIIDLNLNNCLWNVTTKKKKKTLWNWKYI